MKIKKLLKLSIMSGAEVLAGEAYLEKEFTCFNTGESTGGMPDFLVICDEKSNDESWSDYIRVQKEKGASGILFLRRKKSELKLTEAVYTEAETLKLPMIWVSADNITVFMTRIKPFLRTEYEESQFAENWLYSLCYNQEIEIDEELVRRYGYNPEYNYYCLVLKMKDAYIKGRRVTERTLVEAFDVISWEVARKDARVLHFTEDETLVCFLPIPPEMMVEESQRKIRSVVQKVQMKTEAKWRASVGNRVETTREFRYTFQNANKAREMADGFGTYEQVSYYEEWQLGSLMMYAPEYELKGFMKRWLGPILDKPELLDTLSMYILRKGNLKRTAEDLYIHQNTLKYRLDRVGDALGCNLRKRIRW